VIRPLVAAGTGTSAAPSAAWGRTAPSAACGGGRDPPVWAWSLRRQDGPCLGRGGTGPVDCPRIRPAPAPTRSSVSPRRRWLPGPPQGESRIFVDKCLYLSVTMATSAELAGHGAFLQATWGRQASLSTYLLIAQSIYCPQQLGYGPILLLRPLGSCGSCGTHVPRKPGAVEVHRPLSSRRATGSARDPGARQGGRACSPGRPSDAGLAPSATTLTAARRRLLSQGLPDQWSA
jgi:hypothetical protein